MKRHPQISEFEQYVIDFSIEIRKSRNLKHQDVAAILGVSREFIKNVENPNLANKYNMDHVNALADYYGISPKDFFPDKPFPVD